MRQVVYALAALLALPTAAIACSCMTTDDPVQLHEFAEDAAKDAIALVEIEAVQGYDPAKGAAKWFGWSERWQGRLLSVSELSAGRSRAALRVTI